MIVGFIGVGNLASSVISGMRKSEKFKETQLFLCDKFPEKAKSLLDNHTKLCVSEAEVIANSDCIFIAIKPADFEQTLKTITDTADVSGKFFVSTAAAVTTEYISSRLNDAPVIRTMPNLPIANGIGATAVCGGQGTDKKQIQFVCDIFEASGLCVVLPEEMMNKVIAVNGSSPAYVYLFAKAMVDWAVQNGFDETVARQLVAQTIKGSAEMIIKSETSLDALVKAVCSPGGTTIEAVKVLEESDFCNTVARAMDACTAKAEILKK
ncbi:MAG TPA: pyrroline-5-carboxylate reductase [Oscillospiraceae bacterium]|nr:pyrroline-5-carboxylate reductase [Oscillospiraceae bacterium]HPF57109.1 pyrroline-5-carboxylate reductase [Clostridiales bacterium]HPK34224.1 pyrroline-5-carboxylate reductase [Oscillospiraceae bacterium]HPR74873.1 pyrroline-5-carboxylate reductase [Oscillospiraceae bacterium]